MYIYVPLSSLASVEPPQVYYDLKFPENVIEEVRLSSLQLEAVVYACQQHMNTLADGSRAGFLIGRPTYIVIVIVWILLGDGAGVGKGRTVAGIIYQNYIEGRKKSLWYYFTYYCWTIVIMFQVECVKRSEI